MREEDGAFFESHVGSVEVSPILEQMEMNCVEFFDEFREVLVAKSQFVAYAELLQEGVFFFNLI
jgi:hypothetical protein